MMQIASGTFTDPCDSGRRVWRNPSTRRFEFQTWNGKGWSMWLVVDAISLFGMKEKDVISTLRRLPR